MEKTDDTGPENKHKQEKWETTRNQQNRGKTGKEPKVGKMAAGKESDPCRPNTTTKGALEARRGGDG
jgi:hypothetical protein